MDVALDPLPLVHNAHLGRFWAEHLWEEYPDTEDQPPLVLVDETFASKPEVLRLTFTDSVPVMRQWFISADGTRLVQVQRDRLIQNWRRRSPGTDYPRFESLYESFEELFAIYAQFLASNELGSPTIRQAEVTYINQLQPDSVWTRQRDLGKILRSWKPDFGEALLTDPVEDVRVAWRHVIDDGNGPFARLYISVEPIVGGDIVLKLTVRGKPRDASLETTMAFFEMGRERIVKAFTAITTDAMHQRWRRTTTR